MNVTNKVILITGGGGGIGAGIAEAFAEKGAKVAITDINLAYAQAEAARIGGGTIALHHDVTSPESWAEVKAAVEAQIGAVDVLCNNAGISLPFKPMEEITLDQFDRVMAINLRGVFLGCHAFMAEMKARGSGHIVNTSSVNGQLHTAPLPAIRRASLQLRDFLNRSVWNWSHPASAFLFSIPGSPAAACPKPRWTICQTRSKRPSRAR